MAIKFIDAYALKDEYSIDLDALSPQELTQAIETSPLNLFAAWEIVDGGLDLFETMTDHETWEAQA